MKEYEVRVEVIYLDGEKEDKDGRPAEVQVYTTKRAIKPTDSIYDVLFNVTNEADSEIARFEDNEEID